MIERKSDLSNKINEKNRNKELSVLPQPNALIHCLRAIEGIGGRGASDAGHCGQ